jgi:MFS family permease
MKSTSPKTIAILAYVTYLIFGMFNGGLGPVLGELANQTSSSLTAIGGILTFLFLGALIAQLFAGSLIDKFGQKVVLVVSLCLLAIGIFGFTTSKSLTMTYAIMLFTG